jgi:hypothetical protein
LTLLELREAGGERKVLCRLGNDTKAFPSFGAFEQAIGQVIAIAKQNEGWLRQQEQPDHGRSRRAVPEHGPARPGVP